MRICGLLLALLPSMAAAWDQQTPITFASTAFSPEVRYITNAADGGFHAFVLHRNVISFDRYAADGSRLTRVFEPAFPQASNVPPAARLLDIEGGMLALDANCAVRKFDDGGVRWRNNERPVFTSCYAPAVTPSGGLWLLYSPSGLGNYSLSRHDAAGRRLVDIRLDTTLNAASNPVADDAEGVYIAGSDSIRGGPAVLARVDALGAVRWRWQADTPGGAFRWLLPRADGGVLAFGSVTGGFQSEGPLAILSFNANGQRLTSRSIDLLRSNGILGVAGDSESRFAVIARRDVGPSTALFLPSASTLFDLPVGFECVPSIQGCALRILENGDVELPLWSGIQPARLLRVSRTGQLLSDRAIPLLRVNFAVPQADEGWWLMADNGVHRVAPEGATSAVSIQPADVSMQLLGEYQRSDVRLLMLGDAGRTVVARVDAQGTVVWQREFANEEQTSLPAPESPFAFADTTACFQAPAQLRIRCLRLNDGTTLLEVPVNATIGAQFGVFANGTLALIDRNLEGGAEVRRWRIADARPLPPVILPPLRTTSGEYLRLRSDRQLGASMVAIGRSPGGALQAAWFDSDDFVSRNFALQQLPIEYFVDGQYLALIEDRVGGAARRLFLRVLDTAMDRTQMNEEIDAAYDGSRRAGRLIIGNGNRFVSLAPEDPAADGPVRILSVTPDWRSILWLKLQRAPAIGYLAGSSRLLLARDEGAALSLVLLDNDGDRVDARTLPCEAGNTCRTQLVRQGEFGDDVRIAYSRYQSNDADQLRSGTIRLSATSDVPPSQPGLSGPWFHPGIPGQGFLISYIPAANLIFAPWFTYRGAPYGDQSQLAWYYLQGSPVAGAASADLEIVRNTGGRFAAPPITQAEVVGRAELRLTDCDRATLSYTFNANVEGGRSASMPLERLGPRLQACLRTDGTTLSPPTTVADNNGFSQRQSGAWFEPATSGQGLMFEVQPAREGDPGFVFGAWFTYDIPPANDAAAQDWFSLQAPIGTASEGRIELPIVRVIGGELNRTATQNAFRVGTATLTFNGCDRAVFAFEFDTGKLAAEHSGRSGTQQLQRAGGCG